MAKLNSLYATLTPLGMLSLGTYLKNRDRNNVGRDDAYGRFLLVLSPGIASALEVNESEGTLKTDREIMTTIRDGAQMWLDANPEMEK